MLRKACCKTIVVAVGGGMEAGRLVDPVIASYLVSSKILSNL